tara:strand:+ start:447 stop:1004 length:558 start_codon:yes stop_codon:yes gene_type:complete
MRYGKSYETIVISQPLLNQMLYKLLSEKLKMSTGKTLSSTSKTKRNSNVTFINDKLLLKEFLDVTNTVNTNAGWNFNIDTIEPLQYGEYNKSQEYGWHVDQHNKPYSDRRVRKISFSVFINDDYTGGEFDLELHSPSIKTRYETFSKLPLNTALFFQSDYWHRVRPVTKGVRKSLVGWVLGPEFK